MGLTVPDFELTMWPGVKGETDVPIIGAKLETGLGRFCTRALGSPACKEHCTCPSPSIVV